MKCYYIIVTENLKYYIVNKETLEITQYDINIPLDMHNFSHEWKCLGFSKIRPFNRFDMMISINQLYKLQNDLKFKNGRGKYVLRDYDHGAYRMWTDRIIGIWKKEQ